MKDLTVLEVKKIRNTLIFHQTIKGGWFVILPQQETFAIDVESLAGILKFCIRNGLLSRKVLEGILSEVTD